LSKQNETLRVWKIRSIQGMFRIAVLVQNMENTDSVLSKTRYSGKVEDSGVDKA
jgi:hypothetical protein